MRHWLTVLLLLIGPPALAQQGVPEIAFDSVPNPLRLPPNHLVSRQLTMRPGPLPR